MGTLLEIPPNKEEFLKSKPRKCRILEYQLAKDALKKNLLEYK